MSRWEPAGQNRPNSSECPISLDCGLYRKHAQQHTEDDAVRERKERDIRVTGAGDGADIFGACQQLGSRTWTRCSRYEVPSAVQYKPFRLLLVWHKMRQERFREKSGEERGKDPWINGLSVASSDFLRLQRREPTAHSISATNAQRQTARQPQLC